MRGPVHPSRARRQSFFVLDQMNRTDSEPEQSSRGTHGVASTCHSGRAVRPMFRNVPWAKQRFGSVERRGMPLRWTVSFMNAEKVAWRVLGVGESLLSWSIELCVCGYVCMQVRACLSCRLGLDLGLYRSGTTPSPVGSLNSFVASFVCFYFWYGSVVCGSWLSPPAFDSTV